MAATGPMTPRPSNRTYATVQISTAADGLSDAINITGLHLTSIQMSTDWTAAAIGISASIDGSTNYYPVFGSTGDHLVFTTTANRVIALSPDLTCGLQFLQLVSETTAQVAVAQAATRTIIIGLQDDR